MQQCPNCGHQNRSGVVFCENCGANVLGVSLSTKSLDQAHADTMPEGVSSSVLLDVKVQGTTHFAPSDTLRLEIEGGSEPILLETKPETIFGRRDPATGAMPDIDLTPFAGYRMGVSRRHAAIRHGEGETLDLWDLGSSNGTFLNSQRLSAHRPYQLHDGDEIRLGQMMMRLFFEPANHKAQRSQNTPAQDSPGSQSASAARPPEAPAPQPSHEPRPASIRKETGTLLRPPTGPRPVDSVPLTGSLTQPRRTNGASPQNGTPPSSRDPRSAD